MEAKAPLVKGRGVSILARNQLSGLQSEPMLRTIAVENKLFDASKIGRVRKPAPNTITNNRIAPSMNTPRGILSQRNRNIAANKQLLSLETTATAFNTANGIPNTPMLFDAKQGASNQLSRIRRPQGTNLNSLFDASAMSGGGKRSNNVPPPATRPATRGTGKVNIELRFPLINSGSIGSNQLDASRLKAIQTDGTFLGSSSTGLDRISNNLLSADNKFIDQASLLDMVTNQLTTRLQSLYPDPMNFPKSAPTVPPFDDRMPYTGTASAWDRKPKLPKDLDITIPSAPRPIQRPTQRINIGPPPPSRDTFAPSRPPTASIPAVQSAVPSAMPVSDNVFGPPYTSEGATVPVAPSDIPAGLNTGAIMQGGMNGMLSPDLGVRDIPMVDPTIGVDGTAVAIDLLTPVGQPPQPLPADMVPQVDPLPPVVTTPSSYLFDKTLPPTDVHSSSAPANGGFVEPSGIPPTIVPADTTPYDMSGLPNNENWAIFDPTSLPPNVNFTELGPIVDMSFEQPIKFTNNADIHFQSINSMNHGHINDHLNAEVQKHSKQSTNKQLSPDIINTEQTVNINTKPINAMNSESINTVNTIPINILNTNSINEIITPVTDKPTTSSVLGPAQPTSTVPPHLNDVVVMVTEKPAPPQPLYREADALQNNFNDFYRVDLPPPPPPI